MNVTLNLTADRISPRLAKLYKQGADVSPVLEAGALQLLSWTQAAFEDPSKRPLPWPARKRGSNPLLKKSRALQQSLRVLSKDSRSATVGTDRPYAAHHQFGTRPYVIRPVKKKYLFWAGAAHPVKEVKHPGLPARPFFPVLGSQLYGPAEERIFKTMKDAAAIYFEIK
jgi:phage gpG-like protein